VNGCGWVLISNSAKHIKTSVFNIRREIKTYGSRYSLVTTNLAANLPVSISVSKSS